MIVHAGVLASMTGGTVDPSLSHFSGLVLFDNTWCDGTVTLDARAFRAKGAREQAGGQNDTRVEGLHVDGSP